MREELAKILDDADNRWQHGIGSGGYDMTPTAYPQGYFLMLADALLASDFPVEHGGTTPKPERMPSAPDHHGGTPAPPKRKSFRHRVIEAFWDWVGT